MVAVSKLNKHSSDPLIQFRRGNQKSNTSKRKYYFKKTGNGSSSRTEIQEENYCVINFIKHNPKLIDFKKKIVDYINKILDFEK